MKIGSQFSATLGLLLLVIGSVFGSNIPLEHFAALPKFSQPVLSPNGKRIAVTMTYKGEPLLIVQKLNTPDTASEPKEKAVPIRSGDAFFNWYKWGNDDRLVFNMRTTFPIQGSLWNFGRLGSIGRDGKDGIMFKMKANYQGFYRQHANIVSLLEKDSNHILAALDDSKSGISTPEVDLVDINTGKKKRVLKNRKGIQFWLADPDGKIRIGGKTDTKGGSRNVTVFYRETEKSSWSVLQKIDYFDNNRLTPYRFDKEDRNIVLVSSNNLEDLDTQDEGELSLFRFDLTTRKVLGPYENSLRDKAVTVVEKALPGMKVKIVSSDKNLSRAIFRVYSDQKPPEYYLLDGKDFDLHYLGAEYPALKDADLAVMETVSYRAKDNLEIPAYLTIPYGAEKEKLPVVIYPHGGPWARDNWGFDNYVQFFASRGYAVFQPQFRGSTGLGAAHEKAGYGEWGYAIQDDITAGVNWLVEQGIADPNRICIVGSSFGGYAAAIGVAKTPDLYRCAVSINGVHDLVALNNSSRKMLYRTINRAMWNSGEEIEAASPFHLAENITAPLLLIGSELDTVVPVKHSRKLHEKMLKLGKKVSYVELPKGEHFRTIEANEIIKLTAIEKFLFENIGPPN